MLLAKRVRWFFLQSVVIFAVLWALWPVLGESYGKLFRAGGNCLVGLGSGGRVWFSSPTDYDPYRDIEIVIAKRSFDGSMVQRTTTVSSRRHGYMPTVFVLALTLATPIPWSRRWRAIVWVFFLIHAYIALKLAVFPMVYGPEAAVGTSSLAHFCRAGLERLYWIISASQAGWAIVPLFVWALVTLRGHDWASIVGVAPPKPSA